jgi:3-methyladenine DNA glycosylase AlkD
MSDKYTGIISQIREELKRNIDEKTRDGAQHYFKEAVKVYGVKTYLVSDIARKYFYLINTLPKQDIFKLCDELLKSDYSEEAYIAFEWSYYLRNIFEPADLTLFENWLNKYVNTWAKCDTLCNHTIGTFIESFPEYISTLKQWAKSENMWLRRAAAVTLILPARKGKFLEDIFEIADTLLIDKEDLVQKGYGWMLKEASRQHQKEVFEYVMKNKATMPRTALRYAIEKIPDVLRRQAMAK